MAEKQSKERGQGRMFQRGRTWWIAYYHRGTEYRESSKSTDQRKARALLRNRLDEIGADRVGHATFIPNQHKLYVDDLLDRLEADYRRKGGRSLPPFLGGLRVLRREFGDHRAVNLTTDHVDRFVDRLLAEGRAPASVNRLTELLGRALRLAVKERRLAPTYVPYIRMLPERNVRTGFFERAEFEALVANLPDAALQDFCRFAYLTGWRKGEIASLGWADVERDTGRGTGVIHLRAEHSKTGKARKVPLTGELGRLIERRWEARQYRKNRLETLSPLVFHREGQPIRDIRKAWGRAALAAGLPCEVVYRKDPDGNVQTNGQGEPVVQEVRARVLFHDLRRTAVRNMVRAGVDQVVAMSISGHKTISVFQRYNITDEQDQAEALRKTEAFVQSQSTERNVVGFDRKK